MDNIRDPDYEITKTAKEQIRIKEETDKNECIDRVKSIIKREFQRELEFREKQLELIQSRITKAAKTLHLLRYCLVTSFYNRNELQFNASENDFPLLDGQSRIHPAVKKLLGNNPSEIHTTLGLRKKRNMKKSCTNIVIQESTDSTLKKTLIEESENISTDSPIESVQGETTSDVGFSVRNRKLYKHQIVIGNISKWAPSESPDDNSTHKWMMYVRGPKEYPDVTHIIQKVIFFLHPSYKPNDVIEISESPFHLSRRGWGEFPLRIQLFFHGKMNKPVDVIHNLKLDKTYTGRQTLGNETIIELSLYDLPSSITSNYVPITNVTESVSRKSDNQIEETQTQNVETSHEELQYQEHIEIKVDLEPPIVNYINLDHSYCQTDISNTKSSKNKSIDIHVPDEVNLEPEDRNKDVVQLTKKRKPQQSLLKTSILKKIKIENNDVQSSEM